MHITLGHQRAAGRKSHLPWSLLTELPGGDGPLQALAGYIPSQQSHLTPPLCFAFSHISSDSFLCDCQLKWLPPWLLGRMLQGFVTATCAHPESLKGQSIFSVPPESFVCGKIVSVILRVCVCVCVCVCECECEGQGVQEELFITGVIAEIGVYPNPWLPISCWMQFISH